MIASLDVEFCKYYDSQPMILIYQQEQLDLIMRNIKENNFTYYKGSSRETLSNIKDQCRGILLLEKNECRGVDTRFQKDARVIITAVPDDYNQYLQMIGRASRTRGISEGIMFSVGNEKPSHVIQRMKRANAVELMELEELIMALKDRCKAKSVIMKIESLIKQGKSCRSIADIGDAMNDQQPKTKTKVQKKHE